MGPPVQEMSDARQAIVAAARHADPAVIVFDPITSHWHFPRIGDQLHPTPAGHEWIAHRLARGLRAGGSLERAGAGQPEDRLNAQRDLG